MCAKEHSMLALFNSLKRPAASQHDTLAHDRIRLLESRDKLSRFVCSLREIRGTLCDTYRETKGLKMPWTRYRMMTCMIKETIGAFQQIQTMKQLHDREEILNKHGVSDTLDTGSDIGRVSDDGDEVFEDGVDFAMKELRADIERLRLETSQKEEIYRYEGEVFEALHREYRSLQKYGIIQKYIIIKMIIKVAGKSDI